MIEGIYFGILLVLSVWDARKKKVPIAGLVLLSLVSLVSFFQKTGIGQLYTVAVWGMLALLAWRATVKRDWIGGADVWAMGTGAAAFSAELFHKGTLTGVLFGAVAAGIVYWKKKDRSARLPFLPFLFGGMLIWYLWETIAAVK